MGILQRMVSLTKAAANEMLDKIENPVMMMNHYLRDLDDEIGGAERGLLQQQARERVLQAKLDELSGHAKHYEGKAEEAAAAGREAEARTALEAKLLYSEQAAETGRLLQLAKQAAAELQLRLESLKEEKAQLQAKRTELTARVQRASAGAYGSSEPSVLHGSQASRGFDRIEQKVLEWEARTELAKASGGSGYRGSDALDRQAKERSALVEEQLKRLLDKGGHNI
ncbi:PspA/IM30 family protein [Paenibacillus sp. N4]|uniref:PspA/IM30 family protein n=1 Tax=Paenibacillus vietnamensis TaxID=2590547 RepID=UPI001CD0BF40|nr:PspA/IM30 family protein [Paenibacillus vietnamensis]MCA0757696.1 PspA/IM30 family protein [Paenibacillus vietnamensis]